MESVKIVADAAVLFDSQLKWRIKLAYITARIYPPPSYSSSRCHDWLALVLFCFQIKCLWCYQYSAGLLL